ncbi:hypothetical protein KCP77_14225 [Salmonella enterica subsp. enterica]|nr:hypothetical protein KCP77_14225 [Salmonella enterica subsp. enterica]
MRKLSVCDKREGDGRFPPIRNRARFGAYALADQLIFQMDFNHFTIRPLDAPRNGGKSAAESPQGSPDRARSSAFSTYPRMRRHGK